MLFWLYDVIVSQEVITSVTDDRIKVRPGTPGIIVNVHCAGYAGRQLCSFYEIDFVLTETLYVRAIAREHEIARNGPLLN